MSICAPCTRLKEISVCTDEIVIGTVEEADTDYNVYLVSLANGMRIKFAATSDADGLLIIESEGGFNLATGMGYELYVNHVSSIDVQEDLTIDTTTATCYTLVFTTVKDTTYDSQTLSIA